MELDKLIFSLSAAQIRRNDESDVKTLHVNDKISFNAVSQTRTRRMKKEKKM